MVLGKTIKEKFFLNPPHDINNLFLGFACYKWEHRTYYILAIFGLVQIFKVWSFRSLAYPELRVFLLPSFTLKSLDPESSRSAYRHIVSAGMKVNTNMSV